MTTRDMVFVALFAALTAACAVFPPFQAPLVPAPIIVQNIGVMLAGSILGARRGGLSLLLFVVLVAAGLPLLTGWKGGLGAILGPTGGFILSWIPAAFVVGWLVERYWSRLNFWNLLLFNVIGGVIVVYVIGIPWLAKVAGMELGKAIAGSAIFVPGDVVKAVVAAAVAMIVRRSYPLIQIRGIEIEKDEEIVRFQHPVSGHIVNGGTSFSWLWCLLFGFFYFAVKGVWKHAIIGFILAIVTGGISWFIYPFFARKAINNHYLEQGWIPES